MTKKSRLSFKLLVLASFLLSLAISTACVKDGSTASVSATAANMVTDTRTFSVAAGKSVVFYVRAEPKDAMEASFNIQGGDDDVDVYVKDPLGNFTVEKKRATDTGAFAFFSTATGYHQVVFDNTFSTSANKLVWLKINHPGRGGIVP
ncbi:MAG: emp24/gp25L/p24 family protein [Chloroflexi bacterium]|nr:emp24/gp25L/p24 family protein [Chloroflexota bacterium]